MSGKHGTEEITDPVEQMLKRTGCIDLHYKVQECIAETQDWRKCQDQVSIFKECMNKYVEKQRSKINNY
ncbi:PREDICTED: cytochrome c oxidase assembly factor 4 homolog, mitochondrial [Nicrophorus vespilloides]|uniref:Cytochrome c oxidase assembly factor 4 homolog, mitochondrial n=1 Tax=Nicrophorus vespilloides TaxID=110193 RepID=A0ABM1NGC9_NICVS|nr:PREDICTED: cytochrome c oxidase assembly factor 4 homolog, mitochondrial [Nicrophorus vespilloides]